MFFFADQNATTIVADVSSTVSGAARQTQPSSVSDELCFLKLLVPNVVAGSIIGPKGAIISHISSTTRCTVKLSHSTCYFPGTTDRVIMLSGKLRDLKAAFCLVLVSVFSVLPGSDVVLRPVACTQTGCRKK